MELNDNEFDATFRKKVFDADPQFEEAAWDKMEQKLKRRDRIIFFRKSVLVLFALMAGVSGYYTFEKAPLNREDRVSNKRTDRTDQRLVPAGRNAQEDKHVNDRVIIAKNDNIKPAEKKLKRERNTIDKRPARLETALDSKAQTKIVSDVAAGIGSYKQLLVSGLNTGVVQDQFVLKGLMIMLPEQHLRPAMIKQVNPVSDDGQAIKKVKIKRNLPVSLAISAGPEFNSASSVLGGDPGFNAGLTLGFGISRKLDLQTGVRYSIKKYSNGGGISYSFPNTNAAWLKSNLTGLDATCDVLEIPLTASYNVADNSRRSINLNAGVSSYLMLKEDYVFKYDNQYGAPVERTLQKNNANHHFLSVVDLSATYFMKLKSNNLKIGIEPFVKIPLSGVGEGNINLKSSGISLKLRYDLDKKNN